MISIFVILIHVSEQVLAVEERLRLVVASIVFLHLRVQLLDVWLEAAGVGFFLCIGWNPGLERLVVVDLVLRDLDNSLEVLNLLRDWDELQLDCVVSLRARWMLLGTLNMCFQPFAVEWLLQFDGRLCHAAKFHRHFFLRGE